MLENTTCFSQSVSEKFTFTSFFKFLPKKRIETFSFQSQKSLVIILDSSRYAYAKFRPFGDLGTRNTIYFWVFSENHNHWFASFCRKKTIEKTRSVTKTWSLLDCCLHAMPIQNLGYLETLVLRNTTQFWQSLLGKKHIHINFRSCFARKSVEKLSYCKPKLILEWCLLVMTVHHSKDFKTPVLGKTIKTGQRSSKGPSKFFLHKKAFRKNFFTWAQIPNFVE